MLPEANDRAALDPLNSRENRSGNFYTWGQFTLYTFTKREKSKFCSISKWHTVISNYPDGLTFTCICHCVVAIVEIDHLHDWVIYAKEMNLTKFQFFGEMTIHMPRDTIDIIFDDDNDVLVDGIFKFDKCILRFVLNCVLNELHIFIKLLFKNFILGISIAKILRKKIHCPVGETAANIYRNVIGDIKFTRGCFGDTMKYQGFLCTVIKIENWSWTWFDYMPAWLSPKMTMLLNDIPISTIIKLLVLTWNLWRPTINKTSHRSTELLSPATHMDCDVRTQYCYNI